MVVAARFEPRSRRQFPPASSGGVADMEREARRVIPGVVRRRLAAGMPSVSVIHLKNRIALIAAGARGRYSAGVARAVAAATRKAVRS